MYGCARYVGAFLYVCVYVTLKCTRAYVYLSNSVCACMPICMFVCQSSVLACLYVLECVRANYICARYALCQSVDCVEYMGTDKMFALV